MIGENKAKHMTGCAFYMYKRANDYGLDPEKMYILGLLHDIGYLTNTDRHEPHGAALADELGLPGEFVGAILFHSTGLYDMDDKGIPVTKELILTIEADLSVNARGRICGFEKRLEDIKNRYGNCGIGMQNARYIRNFCEKNGIRTPSRFMAQVFGKMQTGDIVVA